MAIRSPLIAALASQEGYEPSRGHTAAPSHRSTQGYGGDGRPCLYVVRVQKFRINSGGSIDDDSIERIQKIQKVYGKNGAKAKGQDVWFWARTSHEACLEKTEKSFQQLSRLATRRIEWARQKIRNRVWKNIQTENC